MAEPIVGLLHPGEMGASLGALLRQRGTPVLWASAGRSAETAERAEEADLEDVLSVDEVARRSDVILSVCPPHAARDVAHSVPGFTGIYVDANAVSPATAHAVADTVARVVDGGIVGPPPGTAGTTRLYVSGPEADTIAALFAGTALEARIVSAEIGAASAVKMAYAAWTKGTAALVLAIRALARSGGVEKVLLDEWAGSVPGLADRSRAAASSALIKGWRWVAEMEEISATFDSAGLPPGFHQAAAEVFRRSPRAASAAVDEDSVDEVTAALLTWLPRQ
jgi:3-hydroxyisobutyrate dehydrogenase-like beta-hydroxyacid dehydrogenase